MRMKKVANGDIPPRFLEQALPPSVRGTALWAGTGNVVCVPRTTTIMGVVKTMMEHGVRRVPVVDAGTHRLEGVMYTTHIVDFLGGGSLHNLVKNKYDGNLLAAINEDVRAIMERGVPTSTPDIHVLDAIGQMAEKGVGGLILLNTSNQVVGIFTERDVLKLITEDVPPE
ncbi:MAG: CBS domain-containing protein, partial [Methermicoccaceae archaeon]